MISDSNSFHNEYDTARFNPDPTANYPVKISILN
jgi:hypothetical protein